MIRAIMVLCASALLGACDQKGSVTDAAPQTGKVESAAADGELKKEQKSIEIAADAAAKLVEQETAEELKAGQAEQR